MFHVKLANYSHSKRSIRWSYFIIKLIVLIGLLINIQVTYGSRKFLTGLIIGTLLGR